MSAAAKYLPRPEDEGTLGRSGSALSDLVVMNGWDRIAPSLDELEAELQARRDIEIVIEDREAAIQGKIDAENAKLGAEAARVRKEKIDAEVAWLSAMKLQRELDLEQNIVLQDTVIFQARESMAMNRWDHAITLLKRTTDNTIETLGTEPATRTAIWLTRYC